MEISAYIQEAACAERIVVLKVRVPGKTSLIVIGSGSAGIVSPGARREAWGGKLPPGVVRQRPREQALEGSILLAIGPSAAFIDQHGSARVVRAHNGRVVVTDDGTAFSSSGRPGLQRFVDLDTAALAELEARGTEILHAIAGDAVAARREECIRIVDRALDRVKRRIAAVRGDLGRIAQADKLAEQAQWLIAEAARAPRGATKLVVTDWSSGEAVPIEVPLDPAKTAKEQIADMFKRAKRLRLGGLVTQDRLGQAERQNAALAKAREQIAAAETLADIDRILGEAKRAAPRDLASPSSPQQQARSKGTKTRLPYRVFFARSGKRVFVGKGAGDNDELTLHVARPQDLWLHTKDRTGAHVIVPIEKGHTCTAEDLVDGAHLAAHFSEVREEKVVDVQYTDRRYIRKPKGSAPGAVVVDKEKVLVLRVEPELLKALLDREET